MKITASKLFGGAGICAAVAGLCYVFVGLFHPPNVLLSVATPSWTIVHLFACGLSFFGLLGMAGLYARQAEKSGWLGLIGFVMLSLWLVLIMGFSFVEAFILPSLVTVSPTFVESWLAIFASTPGAINLGILPTLWTLTSPLYLLGGLLFGIATFRAGILSRWAGVLLALGTGLAPLAALLSLELQPKIAVPVGLGLIWLGYSLFMERREKTAEASLDLRTIKAEPSKVA